MYIGFWVLLLGIMTFELFVFWIELRKESIPCQNVNKKWRNVQNIFFAAYILSDNRLKRIIVP